MDVPFRRYMPLPLHEANIYQKWEEQNAVIERLRAERGADMDTIRALKDEVKKQGERIEFLETYFIPKIQAEWQAERLILANQIGELATLCREMRQELDALKGQSKQQ